MYSIGDNVIYGSSGVMKIVDIRRERILSDEREYYVLKSPRAQAGAFTFVPVDNEKLTSMMRHLPTKEEIMEILHSGEIASEEEWVKDNRIRTDRFKQVIERGDLREIIAMIRLIYKMGLSRQAEGKKKLVSDESTRLKAERLISAEFSLVLGIPEDEVGDFIAKELGE